MKELLDRIESDELKTIKRNCLTKTPRSRDGEIARLMMNEKWKCEVYDCGLKV